MRWLYNISFSSSSGSQTSSSSLKNPGQDSPTRRNDEDTARFSFGALRKLTRQRKLRHLTDQDISGGSEPLSRLLRSPSNGTEYVTPRFSSASAPAPVYLTQVQPQPQPLPLPGSGICCRKEGSTSGDVYVPLPSPKTGPSRGFKERFRDGVCSNSPIRR